MHVKVSEIDGVYASTLEAGNKLHDLIKPALDRAEEVVLDFEGMKHVGPGFLNGSLGLVIERDHEDRRYRLVRVENLNPLAERDLESIIDYATRRRENPAWAAGWTAALMKRLEEDRE